VLLDVFPRLAAAALEDDERAVQFEGFGRRKLHRPEVEIGIDERDAVNEAARFAANLPDEADFGFLGGIGQAHGQAFIGRKTVSRDDASAVAAEYDSFCVFRKHFSRRVGAEQNDSYFFGDTSAAAFTLHSSVYAPLIGRALLRSTAVVFESLAVRIVMRSNAMGNTRFEQGGEELA